MALLEIGEMHYIKNLDKVTLFENYKYSNFQKILNFISKEIKKKFPNEKMRIPEGFFKRNFNKIYNLFFSSNPIKNCVSFHCLVIKTMNYIPGYRPSIQNIIECIDKL